MLPMTTGRAVPAPIRNQRLPIRLEAVSPSALPSAARMTSSMATYIHRKTRYFLYMSTRDSRLFFRERAYPPPQPDRKKKKGTSRIRLRASTAWGT